MRVGQQIHAGRFCPLAVRGHSNGDAVAWVATVFEARITSGVPTPGDDETGEVRWATPAEAFEVGLTPGTRHMLTRLGEGCSFDS